MQGNRGCSVAVQQGQRSHTHARLGGKRGTALHRTYCGTGHLQGIAAPKTDSQRNASLTCICLYIYIHAHTIMECVVDRYIYTHIVLQICILYIMLRCHSGLGLKRPSEHRSMQPDNTPEEVVWIAGNRTSYNLIIVKNAV